MSIVIVAITPKYAVAMSDGRVIKNQMVIDENFKKIHKLNPYIGIGFTGHMAFLRDIFFEFEEVDKELRVDQFFQMIYEISKNLMDKNQYFGDSNIVVFGVDSCNKMKSIGFSTKDFIIYEEDGTKTGLSLQVLNNHPNAFEITKQNIRKNKNLVRGMEETIHYISTVDESVNNIIFVEKISL